MEYTGLYDSNGNKLSKNQVLLELLYLDMVTRIEVIDENGRSYVNKHSSNKVELSLQDNDRTLKVFISKPTQNVNVQ